MRIRQTVCQQYSRCSVVGGHKQLATRWLSHRAAHAVFVLAVPQMTSRSCSVCQTSEGRPFPSNKELLAHVVSTHQRRICTICLQVGNLPVASGLHAA